MSGTDLLEGGNDRFIGALVEGEREEIAERLVALVQSSDDAIISKDLNSIVTSWNEGATRIFGYRADEMIGRSITLLIPPDRPDEEPAILERIRRGERIEHYETERQCKDGKRVTISLTVSPIKNRHGIIVGASKIARDVTDRKRAEEARDLLLQEIQHRVKNTLGTVLAVAAQTFKTAPQAERKAFEARVHALANAHALLTQSNWNRTTVGDVVQRAIQPFRMASRERFVMEGPAVDLDAAKAVTLAMVLHELATNAVKYGALSSEDGMVAINWSLVDDADSSLVRLIWQERGGPPVSPPMRKGFGSTLIEKALRGTQGETKLRYEREGLTCEIDMRL
jgi:PAS domain S-box-containing protein